jgi:hypothetical protein
MYHGDLAFHTIARSMFHHTTPYRNWSQSLTPASPLAALWVHLSLTDIQGAKDVSAGLLPTPWNEQASFLASTALVGIGKLRMGNIIID